MDFIKQSKVFLSPLMTRVPVLLMRVSQQEYMPSLNHVTKKQFDLDYECVLLP